MTCGIEAGGGTRVVLGMVQADRARVSDFVRSDGNLPGALVARAEVRPVMIAMVMRRDDNAMMLRAVIRAASRRKKPSPEAGAWNGGGLLLRSRNTSVPEGRSDGVLSRLTIR